MSDDPVANHTGDPHEMGMQKQSCRKKTGARKIMTRSSEMLSMPYEPGIDETSKSNTNRGQTNKKVPVSIKNPPPINLRIRCVKYIRRSGRPLGR